MSSEAMLISALSAVVAALVALALYIKKMHNSHVKTAKETQDVLIKIVEKNTEGFQEMKSSIQMNTEATKNGAEQMRGATDRLANAVDNLNRDIRNHNER